MPVKCEEAISVVDLYSIKNKASVVNMSVSTLSLIQK